MHRTKYVLRSMKVCFLIKITCKIHRKRNLVITTRRILFSVLVQYLVNIIKYNNNNRFVIINKIKLAFNCTQRKSRTSN